MHIGFEFLAHADEDHDIERLDRCLAPLLAALLRHPHVHCAAAIDDLAARRLRELRPALAEAASRLTARGQLQHLHVSGEGKRGLPHDSTRAWVAEGMWARLGGQQLLAEGVDTLVLHPRYALIKAQAQAVDETAGITSLRHGTVAVGQMRIRAVAGERRAAPWLLHLEPAAALQRSPVGVVPLTHFGIHCDSHDLLYIAGWIDDYFALLPALQTPAAPLDERWPMARVVHVDQLNSLVSRLPNRAATADPTW